MRSSEPGVNGLTHEQLLAVASPHRLLYIEAAPGSGKTTVSTQRFGLHRFARTTDQRAAVAVSFTRSATEEIRSQVLQHWGPSALAWPHRIVTLDTVLYDLLTHLLQTGLLQWPGNHQELEVLDTWRTHLPTTSTRRKPVLALEGTRVITSFVREAKPGSQVSAEDFATAVSQGRCTHDNVREVLQLALHSESVCGSVITFFFATIRSLIVDEIYDANDLDLEIIRLAADAGLNVTLVGDPWQALYGFRGARPDNVPRLISRQGFERSALRTSFRWCDRAQESLALQLRRKERTVLPIGSARDVNVVLAGQWKVLWDTDPHVLPLAIKPRAGQFQEAACTLLLNELVQSAFGQHAVFVNDARITLGIRDDNTLAELRPHLQTALERLAGQQDLGGIWTTLVDALLTKMPTKPTGKHERTPLTGLKNLRTRLHVAREQLVPGLTCHQAKGRQWDKVGIRLEETDAAALLNGLDPGNEHHRSLYVALTRARHLSLAV
ncbi:UvrD-helicase domain-containing protein [Streptomyces demainii]|uniref:DNA helicase-2/ATP-dependent DNA helicase PcrA n=1 Tax=Streptomyces demainii TaxID=588122 RepID=A0ABT9KKC1_9ACTN|nr:UvrD-helicase domain-containing protein [Streptomyces demainii]MDP9607987.1 DNA helicase-2/ATP-dependent DNA helicase PcrA [Streptomyces demainii]